MLGRVYIEKWWTPEQMEAARRRHDVDMQAAFGLSGSGFLSPAKTSKGVAFFLGSIAIGAILGNALAGKNGAIVGAVAGYPIAATALVWGEL